MTNVYIIPKANLALRDPNNPKYFIPAEGCEIQDSMFWRRRQIDGDVVIHSKKPDAPKLVAPVAPVQIKSEETK